MPPGAMPPGQGPSGPQPPAGGGNNNVALFVIGGLVLVALVIGAVVLLTGDDDDDGDDHSQQQAGNQQEQPADGGGGDGAGGTADPNADGGTEAGGGAGGGGGAGRQEYLDAIAAEMRADPEWSGVNPVDVDCIAGSMVDAWGVEGLQAAGTPQELSDVENAEAVGLATDEAWGGQVYDNMQTCMDLRQVLVDQAMSDPSMPADQAEGVACIFENLTDDELREVFVSGLAGGDQAASEDLMTEAAVSCVGG